MDGCIDTWMAEWVDVLDGLVVEWIILVMAGWSDGCMALYMD